MKRIILLTLLLALFSTGFVYSQSVPSTGDGALPCRFNCQPNGWYNGWFSSVTKAGGEFPWSGAPLPAPPSNPVGADGGKYFLTAYSSNTIEMGAYAHMTGLIPGRKYTVKCYLMSARAELESGLSDYGEQGSIGTIGANTIINFTNGGPFGSNVNQWVEATLKFTAQSDKQTLSFSAETHTDKGGFINLDLRGEWLTADLCDAGTEQVNVNAVISNICPANTANLNSALLYPNDLPPGSNAFIWYTNPQHTGSPVPNPAAVPAGTYYAFITDVVNDCYNTNMSIAKVTVGINNCPTCNAGTAQVPVSSTLSNSCPATTVNLANAVTGAVPPGTSVVWYSTPNHSGVPTIPGNASAGVYYAFFYDSANGCYNTNNSTAKVTVTINPCPACAAGTDAVPLKASNSEILCPATSVNLVLEFFNGLIPSGTELRFFTNPNHSGVPLSNVNVGAGTYYAFFYDPAKNCYNQDISTAKMEVTYKKCVDLTPTLTINGLNFPEGGSRDFVINLYEVNNRETSGTTTFRITKIGGFNITYPTGSTISNVAGGIQNQNKNWTFSETDNFITVKSTRSIPANGKAVIGFTIQRKPGISKGVTQNITPTILTGAGGDSNSTNNNSVTSVSTN